jgi:hypothetical protein
LILSSRNCLLSQSNWKKTVRNFRGGKPKERLEEIKEEG